MKAIPLWQPWASLWCCSPAKIHETRGWHTDVRGWVLVHACKRFVRDVDRELEDILSDEFGGHWGMELPTGALIGAVNIVDCLPVETVTAAYLEGEKLGVPRPDDYLCGDFTPGRFAIQRSERKTFRNPIPYKGEQKKFFDVPDDLVREAMAA